MSRNSWARMVYGVSISVTLPSKAFHFLGAAACYDKKPSCYFRHGWFKKKITVGCPVFKCFQCILAQFSSFSLALSQQKTKATENRATMLNHRLTLSDRPGLASSNEAQTSTNLVQEVLDPFVVVFFISNQFMPINGGNKVGFLFQKSYKSCFPLWTWVQLIYQRHFFIMPF